jgi:CarD family transcriptional regulator
MVRFEDGDVIVHPFRGAGVVIGVEKRELPEGSSLYYRIQLVGQPDTKLTVPTDAVKELGLRRGIPQTKLTKVWRVLRADPEVLPSNCKKRYQLLRDKPSTGDLFRIAGVVRDMVWRRQRTGCLNAVEKRLYEKGISFLTGEIAAVQDTDVTEAEAQVRAKLMDSMAAAAAT